MKLAGKTLVITGAAHGLGRAFCQRAYQENCRLILIDRDQEALQELALALGGRLDDPRLKIYTLDLEKTADIRPIVQEILAEVESVSLLLNNAAVSIDAPLLSSSEEDINWILNINLRAIIHLSRAFLAHFQVQGSGHILNISSAAGLLGFPNKSLYCSTKFALRGFSSALRAEVKQHNIGVSCAFLGPMKSNMLQRSRVASEEQREKIHRYLNQSGMELDKVVAILWRGIEKNRGEMMISSQTVWLYRMHRLFPGFLAKTLAKYQHLLPA